MKIFAIIVGILILIIFIAFVLMFKGPDISQFEHLIDPKISVKEDMKMIVVKAEGDPNDAGSEAFRLLFKTYFKIKGAPKGPKQPAPRARWPISVDVPKSEWIGFYAMPVPEQTTTIPKIESELNAELEIWKYGEVAEILHLGSYASETPTIKRLHNFITEQGYQIIGNHEEEYIKGPGMFSKGIPEKYITVIRYRVQKQEAISTEINTE